MKMNRDKPVLLLVGRTGNGKSSTGNSILNQEVFETRAAWEKAIHDTPARSKTGSWVVVDGSGIGDTGDDLIGGQSAANNSSDLAFKLCGKTITAIILVLKYGVRFTKQEKDAVQMIKFLFGEDVLRKWGIIVMTYGDNFEKDNFEKDNFEKDNFEKDNFEKDNFEKDNLEEDKTELFKSWCKKQGGDFKSVYEECNRRCVLFNNRANGDEEKVAQVAQLFSAVDEIKNRVHVPYREEDYSSAEARRLYMQLISQGPQIREDCADFLKDVNNRLANIGVICKRGRPSFKVLLVELDDRLAYLRDSDNETGLLTDLMADVTAMKRRVERARRKQWIMRALLITLSISLPCLIVIFPFVY